jgi:two-component system alkaline phosphatase synthesis response regulator PhoP
VELFSVLLKHQPLIKMKTVLVIENDQSILSIVKYILEDAGYRVNVLKDKATLGFIKTTHPRVVLIEQWLSSRAGRGLCLHLNTNAPGQRHSVLLMGVQSSMAQTAKKCCADAMPTKPFDVKDLIKKVNKLAAIAPIYN